MDVREAQTSWERFRRAPIVRALAVYAGTAFAVVQGADIFTNQFGLPDWFFQGTLVLLLIVLFLLLVTAHRYMRRRDSAPAAAPRSGPDITATAAADPSAARAGRGPEDERKAPERPAADPTRRRLTWGRLTWGAVMAMAGWGVVVAVYMVMRSLGIGPVGTLIGQGVLDARERVILADLESRTGDALLASAATEALRIDLSQSPALNLVDPDYVSRALARMQRERASEVDLELAREIALRDGINAVIGGEINAVGSGFVLTVSLVAAQTGDILAGFRETAADSSGIIPAIDRLSNRLRERIGESLRTIRRNEPLAQVTTGSLEALRRYSQGIRARQEGDFTRARALLEEAVALDSAFAMAWRALGIMAHTRTEQVEALTRAYELRDRLTDRERYLTLGTYYSNVTYETARGIAAYRTLLETYPDDSWALNNLAVLHEQSRDYHLAEELFARAVAVDSFSAPSLSNLATVQFALGKPDEARRTIELFAAAFPRHPNVDHLRVELATATGDYEEAERRLHAVAEGRRDEPQVRANAQQSLGNLALLRGRPAEAERWLTEGLSFAAGLGLESPQLAMKLGFAFHDIWLRADTAAARRRVARALEEHPLPRLQPAERPYSMLGQFYALVGEVDRAREILGAYEAAHGPEMRGNIAVGRDAMRAMISLAEDRPREAIEHLRRADAGACPVCILPALAFTFGRAGQPDSARVAFEAYLDTPWLHRLGTDALFLPMGLERLGELHRERGQKEEAVAHYTRFVDLWEHAEPDMQPRVERARQALRELEGELVPAGAPAVLDSGGDGPLP